MLDDRARTLSFIGFSPNARNFPGLYCADGGAQIDKFHRPPLLIERHFELFPGFHKNVNSLKLLKYISENSSPKESF